MTTDVKGPSEFVNQAYSLDDDDKMVDFYRNWADDYDHQMLDELGYTSPITIARLLDEYLPDKNARIYDIGCGTGLTCVFLHQQGYRALDGIDLSPDMVRVAENRGIYQDVLLGDVNQPLAVADNSYDAAISSGTFTHGHVGPGPLQEIFRILRPGGILACTVHMDLWQSKGFETSFESLVATGTAERLHLELDKYYKSGDLEGWFCVYRKNQ
jgi:predicted TPR repeat methyltransferase